MTNKLLTLFILLLLAAPIRAQQSGTGVSKELAESRKGLFKDIKYDLTFNIPQERQSPVTGTEVLTFTLLGRQDVVLDFKGQFQVQGLVNRKRRTLQVDGEHIVIPQKFLKKGVNTVQISFTCGDKSLNRHGDYLYTLFVPDRARTVFPCFDQPDMKAYFKAHLNVPKGWRTMTSDATKPLPTYLFSFVAGKFNEQTATRDGRQMRVLHRETDPQKTAQLETLFDQAALSLKWLEQYTGLSYPFATYGFAVLPNYQYGGMEHPGAIQLNANTIFLGASPTPDELLRRQELIAHETAHMWFGDLVTMRWFDDVWTKEVFANFMAAKIARQQDPETNLELNFLKMYQARALSTDRTEGTHPIRQQLGNLEQAGLMYGNIIYDKAPVMMRKLEEVIGRENFRKGIQAYLRQYAYGNATWSDLISLLDEQNPDAQVQSFSHAWVNEKGMPTIDIDYEHGRLVVTQTDPYGRNLVWRQRFDVLLGYDLGKSRIVKVDVRQPRTEIAIEKKPDFIIPNYHGRGYGRFTMNKRYTKKLTERLFVTRDDVCRYAVAQTLFENYLMGRVEAKYFGELFRTLEKERNPLIMSALVSQMSRIAQDQHPKARQTLELCMHDALLANHTPQCRQYVIRALIGTATSPAMLDTLYNIWQANREKLFDERDYMNMAYYLAVMKPELWQTIVTEQRSRLTNDDLRREFDFVSRACTPDANQQRVLFNELLHREGRMVEPWATRMLSLLCCNAREPQNNYLLPYGLQALEDIQRTSDIFFPAQWLKALLGGHQSDEARQMVQQFLNEHPDYPPYLRNKLLEAAYLLLRK